MRIVEKIFFEYILCYLAQSFIITLGVYAFCRKKIMQPHYLISTAMIFAGSVLIHLLSFNLGVPTLFIMMLTVLVSIWYLRFPTNLSIKSGLFITLILLIGEIINILFLNLLLGKEQFTIVMNDDVTKFIYAIPSTIIALVITLAYYFIAQKRHPAQAGEPSEQDNDTEGDGTWKDF